MCVWKLNEKIQSTNQNSNSFLIQGNYYTGKEGGFSDLGNGSKGYSLAFFLPMQFYKTTTKKKAKAGRQKKGNIWKQNDGIIDECV